MNPIRPADPENMYRYLQ